jgi:hypothetical protein
MGKTFSFWRACVKRAAHGSSAFANDWQWLLGFPALAAFLWLLDRWFGEGAVSLNTNTAVGAFAAAGAAFIITWLIAFVLRIFKYYEEKARADTLANQIRDIGMERPLCYTTVKVLSIADATEKSFNPTVDVWFENLGDKMLSHVKEMSIQINGVDCLLGDPSPGNNRGYIHAG